MTKPKVQPKAATKSKTVYAGIIVALLGAVNAATETLTDPFWLSISTAVAGVLTVVLRFLTEEPIALTEK